MAIDVQNHATEIANATPNNLAGWQVDMDESSASTISLEKLNNLILVKKIFIANYHQRAI